LIALTNDAAMMPSTNPAHVYELVALIVIFFLTSVIGVVTGGNSLITVPAMLAFGIEPRVALATNMFGLTFWSLGGTLPFLGSGAFDRRRLSLLVSLTLVGSVLGALLVFVVPSRAMPLLISIFMLAVAASPLRSVTQASSPRRLRHRGRRNFWAMPQPFCSAFTGAFSVVVTSLYSPPFSLSV